MRTPPGAGPLEDLVGAAQHGDRRALDELLRGCLPLVYNVAARSLSPADADDVVQETMLRAVAALPRLRRPDRFRSWLMAIAVRETRRRGGRLGAYHRQFVPVDDLAPHDAAVEEDTVQRLEAGRQRRELADATGWLEPDDRELLQLWWLVQVDAITRQDLVETVGVSPAHARVRLQRLRNRLATARLIVAATGAAGGPGGCETLRHLVADWDGRPSSVWRKRLARHVTGCHGCGAAKADLLAPERLLVAIPLLVPPLHLFAPATVAPMTSTVAMSADGAAPGGHAVLTRRGIAAVAAAVVVVTGLTAAYLGRGPDREVGTAPAPAVSSTRPSASAASASAPPAAVRPGAGNGGPAWQASQLPPTQGGRHLYVAGTGNDRADGLSRATAVRTLRRAAQLTRPGDTVLVDDGEYTDAQQSAVLPIERSGTAQQWITWAAYPGARPVVRATSWQGIHVHAAYIVVSGFTVVGSRERLSPAQLAAADRGDVSDPQISSNCIAVDEQRTADPQRRPHHVVVWGNTVTDCPLSGISAMLSDHVTIAYNVAARNGHHSPYGGSGISVHSSWASDGSAATKMVVRGNVVHDNANLVPCLCSGSARSITDGNGIIVESTDEDPYPGRTLVENNIAYNNGGRGINVFRTAHVDVVNNTLFHNAATPSIDGDLAVVRSTDVRVLNSIVVARGGRAAVNVSDAGSRFEYNLLVGRSNAPSGPGQRSDDPRFVDPGGGNFALGAGSPAIDSGGALLAPAADADRLARDGRCDRGALEVHSY